MHTKKAESAVKKPASKSTPKKKEIPAKECAGTKAIPHGREHKLADQSLKFVDEAAALLRTGIQEGAAMTAKSRIAAKKKAHNLLGKASHNLSKAIEESTSVLQDLLKKI